MSKVRGALANVQREISVPKSHMNKFGNYSYRSLEDINAAAKPICEKYHCGYAFTDELVAVGDRFYVRATAFFWADGSDEMVTATAWAREALEKKGMDEAQITGLASSYARKYAACALFAIDSGEEVDAMENGAPKRKDAAKPRAQARQKDDGGKAAAWGRLKRACAAYEKSHPIPDKEHGWALNGVRQRPDFPTSETDLKAAVEWLNSAAAEFELG